MALVIKDRVKQTTTTTGTGTLTLNGTIDGFQTFAAALSDGDTTYYALLEPSTNNWEVGLGTWTEGSSLLARTTVLASSNSGSAVNLTAQTEVFISQPAGKAAFFSADGDLELTRDPQTALQAATKEYVDTIAAAGLHYHDPVRVEKEGNLNVTYDNGTAGVGATLTNAGTQAALVIDGVTMVLNDRVLVYEQADATQNGVYTVTDIGSASTNWVLTRSTDTDSYAPSDPNSFGKGDAFFVLEGNAGAGELYVMNTEGAITFGTTNITFTQVASTAVYSAGNGVTLTGTVFAADAGTGVTVDGSGINIGQAVETTSDVTFNSVAAPLTGNVTGNVTGDVTGNADTATALETARNIGGVSFDGTASINLPGVNTAGNQDTTGNAATATAWETGRTISLTGDVTGSVTGVDGSGNATIATTIQPNSVALGTDTTGDYVSTVTSGNYLTGGTTGEGSTPTLNVDATPTNTASKVVARDASGNFSAGTITVSNVTVSGTVDGRDVSVDGTKLDGIATSANNYTHPSHPGDDINIDTGALTGATVISDLDFNVTTDTLGHVTDANATVSTRNITLADLGYTGATNANYITNNNQLTNGAGYTTYTANQSLNTTSNVTHNNVTGTAWVYSPGYLQAPNAYIDNAIYHNGDTDTYLSFGTNTITLATGGSSEITVNTTGVRLGDTGNGYFQPVSGSYGSIQIDGGAHNGYEGYSIGGRAVFMHDNGTAMGLYDDVNNHWGVLHTFNGATQLYHDGSSKIQTTSSGANVSGNLYLEGSVGEDYDALSGTSPTCNVDNAGAFSLTMSGNTTFTFSGADSGYSMGFILQLTGNGSTVTWPSSVKWAGGTAPDAPASGETDVLVFHSRDGGTNWYGVLSSDAAA